jgi:outer membrane receptor protein involved in Fe transport
VSYTWATHTLSADGLFGSGLRRGFANSESLPSYGVLNVAASRLFSSPGIGKLDVRVSLLNVLDRVYQLRDGSGIGVGAPQFGPRRAVYLSLRKDF